MLLGGKCSICGYNRCLNALEFHHNKGKKEEVLSVLIRDFSKQKSLKEIRKCILLCANCHRELHAGL
jgi:predicted HNH restriction endonuclease